ncbi:MAG: hypothetical protein ABI868_13995 [Acidobacteriota bacterium]
MQPTTPRLLDIVQEDNPMPRDQAEFDEALKALRAAGEDPNPDYSWATDLPEAPPMPTQPDETIAIVWPSKPK